MASLDLCFKFAEESERHWNRADFAKRAALAIVQDCNDRRGISGQFDLIDQAVLESIVDDWAEIIRHAKETT